MSLKACQCCGKGISPYAVFCPRCGRPGDGSYPIPATVSDIDMKFASIVSLMVKASIAAIPALFILMVAAFFIWAVLSSMFGARH